MGWAANLILRSLIEHRLAPLSSKIFFCYSLFVFFSRCFHRLLPLSFEKPGRPTRNNLVRLPLRAKEYR